MRPPRFKGVDLLREGRGDNPRPSLALRASDDRGIETRSMVNYFDGLDSPFTATTPTTVATPAAVITATLATGPRPKRLKPLPVAAVSAPAAGAVTVTAT